MNKLLLAGVAAMAMLPMTAAARGRVVVLARPVYAPYGWYGWYGPWAYYPPGPYFGAPNAGQVKVDTDIKDAEVFINGAYAGRVKEVKTMTLRPGSYNIEVRAPGRARFAERVYVMAGKTTKLRPDLRVDDSRGPSGS